MDSAGGAKNRIWEIDFLRGLFILLMVVFHFFFDLYNFTEFKIIDFNNPIIRALPYFSAIFISASGISSTFSRNNVRRGLKLMAVALAISLVTYLISPDVFVKFGILHFLAVCMIAWPIFGRLDWKWLVALGLVIIGLGLYFTTIHTDIAFLFPFGITVDGFSSGDYYPLFPYAGIFMFGAALGKTVYAGKKSLLKWDLKPNVINLAGRHSLLIYVFHQPLIIGALWIASKISGWELTL